MIKFKKTISVLIIVGLLLSYVSYFDAPSAYAVPTVDPGSAAGAAGTWAHFVQYVLKEFVLDLAARLIARLQLTGALNGIAQQVLQSGRTGRSPAFIQNWRNFITDSEYRGEDVFRAILSNTANCPHIRNDVLSMFGVRTTSPLTQNIRTNNLDPFTIRGRCTMPTGWSIQNYNQDFAGQGGWEALARLAQPENNFYGSTIMAMGELNAQRGLDKSTDVSEAIAGQGFTGVRRSSRTGNSCDTPPAGQCTTIDGSIGSGVSCTSNSDCSASGFPVCTGGGPSQARCTFLGSVTTPSKILGDGASEFIDSNLKWLTTSDEISEVLGNFIATMIGRLANYTANSIAPGNVEEPQRAQYDACVRQCNNNSLGSQYAMCVDNCSRQAGVALPPNYGSFNTSPGPTTVPTVTPVPPSLPAASTAVTLCDDGTTSPTPSKTCLTGQWVRQGDSLNIDPTGLCDSSHCVVLNYSIILPPTNGEITQSGRLISNLTGAIDWASNTRVDINMADGLIPYTLNIGNGSTRIDISVPVPTGGSGGGGGGVETGWQECSDGVDNNGDAQIDYPADPNCTSLADTNEAF